MLEVFLAAVEHEETRAGLGDDLQLTWLRRVAHNKIVDHYRRSLQRQAVALDEITELLDDDESREPEPVLLRREEYALLRCRLNSRRSCICVSPAA